MNVKGITIHNTGNDYSASELYEILKNDETLNYCHYLIDEKEIKQTIPDDMSASHTGKGYDFGNKYTIAIEICRSTCEEELYLEAEKKAVKHIKKLMKKYKLTNNDLYFHMDFNPQARCPHRILDIYGTQEEFINAYFI